MIQILPIPKARDLDLKEENLIEEKAQLENRIAEINLQLAMISERRVRRAEYPDPLAMYRDRRGLWILGDAGRQYVYFRRLAKTAITRVFNFF